MNRKGTSGVYISVALRLLTALALFIDAGVHFFMAPGYQYAQPGTISQGTLFLLEAAAALVAGIYVLVRGSRAAYALALLVAFSAFAAVMLYRYVDIPAIGPIPAMYDPVWFFSKTLSAVAEGAGTLLALAGLVRTGLTAKYDAGTTLPAGRRRR
ncbi:hypothetical protein GCM10007170_05860 [Arthrobacter liuii]|uniref:DoxX family protein n=1 Tax=Arthrobacter liuii TaxID=1476996 RepID=A0ABQ2AJM1_9MICC|nr:hypothetical protein GCM10007170_05860 [Arthrobacter liuii]